METRSRNLIRENASRNVPANYPGSGQRPGTRRSFRTPVQTLPLSVQKSASKSFVVLANQEEKETPKTLIAGFIESAETKPVVTRTLRRRSERISGSPNPNAAFKSPRMSDVLKKKLRKKDPQMTKASVASPGSEYTPRTNIRNFLATTEQEQTPLIRDSETKYQLSEFLPSGTKKRRSGWGQKLSISPLHVSHSTIEGGFQEEEIVQNFVEKKSKRTFQLKRTTEYNEAELLDDRPAQKLVSPTLESKESLEKLGLPENSESEDDSLETPEINGEIEETDKLVFHQRLRSENMRQESSIEQQITTVAKLVQDPEKQGSLSKSYLHDGLDSNDLSDKVLLQRSNAVSNSQNNGYPQLRVSLDRHEVLSSNQAGHSVEHVLLQPEINLTSQKFRQVNTSHRHDSPVKEVPDFMSVAGRPGHLLEDQATRSSEQIFTSSESPHAAAVEEDIEEPLIPFKDNVTLRDNDVVSERVDHIPSDFQGQEMEAKYSKKNDDDKQQKTIQRTNRKRALESDDDDDELPSGISSLNTPHFTMTKQPQVPSTQRQPKMKQTTLTVQVGLSKATTDQAQQTNAKAGRVKATRGKGTKNQTMHLTLPRNSVKFFAERHSSMKLSKDAVDEIVKVSETYWSDTWKALEAYALHAGRKKINEEDVILLMKTQRTITGITDLHDKIREYLPMELRTELIPLKL
ncbi:hypothetical protein Btru_068197 [Bulinus truncatus]|nr:hypothetical protein Btru_068197 [Bulinus truncatus]